MITIQLFSGEDKYFFKEAMMVRETVFTQEQGYDAEIDHDEFDAVSWHVVIYDGEKPVGTGRMFENSIENCYQIGRVAIIKSHRGQYLGQKVMQSLLKKADSLAQYPAILLHAQTHALSFYQNLGFLAEGDIYLEEGEPHITMRKLINV